MRVGLDKATAGTLELMQCDRMNLRLTVGGCARLHVKARDNPPASYDPKSACQFCPIGAVNAGAPIAPMAEAAQSLSRLCSRCEKPTHRRINGMFCPSCYNRDREARIGKNRKGTEPRKILAALHSATVVVACGAGVTLATLPRVAARTEAMALLARGSDQPMFFGVPPLRLEQHV